jgi:hypothetical protein
MTGAGEPRSPEERDRLAAALREALEDLGDVFSDLVLTAEEKSCLRCPYMDVRRRCTAHFECPNQVWTEKGRRALCSGEHKIDFSK